MKRGFNRKDESIKLFTFYLHITYQVERCLLFSHPLRPLQVRSRSKLTCRWNNAYKGLSKLWRHGLTPLIGVRTIQWSPELVIWTAQCWRNIMGSPANLFSQCSSASWTSGSLDVALRSATNFPLERWITPSSISGNTTSTIDHFIARQIWVSGK